MHPAVLAVRLFFVMAMAHIALGPEAYDHPFPFSTHLTDISVSQGQAIPSNTPVAGLLFVELHCFLGLLLSVLHRLGSSEACLQVPASPRGSATARANAPFLLGDGKFLSCGAESPAFTSLAANGANFCKTLGLRAEGYMNAHIATDWQGHLARPTCSMPLVFHKFECPGVCSQGHRRKNCRLRAG